MKLYDDEPEFLSWGVFPEYVFSNTLQCDYWGIQYNHQGNFHYSLDGSEPEFFSGAYIFLTSPGHVFRYGTPENETRNHNYVTFRGGRTEQYVRSGIFERLKPFLVSDRKRFFQCMQELFFFLSCGRKQEAVNLLDRLFLMIFESEENLNHSHETAYSHELLKLANRIMQAPLENWNFEAEAEKLGISYPQFRRLFRNRFSRPPYQFVLDCRFQRGASLILQTDLQIREIAAQCGFSDTAAFVQQFRKRYSFSPLKYRQSQQNVLSASAGSSAPSKDRISRRPDGTTR